MPEITVEMLPVLAKLGIIEPTTSAWRRLLPWELRYIRARHFCDCQTPGVQVEMAFTWLASRKVFIGQCSACQAIYWREAVGRGR